MMQEASVRGVVLLLVVTLAGGAMASQATVLSRWSRQAIHCQAGDEACKMCSTSCNTVEESRLPECCEAYNACCDEYFEACKKCDSVAAKDRYFPEYCCASFTDCCHLITTFKSPVKPPEPMKKEPKIDLKIPTVAAPKPTEFPGSGSQPPAISAPQAAPAFPTLPEPVPHTPAFPSLPQAAPQAPTFPTPKSPAFAPQTPSFAPQTPALAPQSPAFSSLSSGSVAPEQSRVQVGASRTRGRTQARHKPQQAPRRPPQHTNGRSRSGRVTSRGRVLQ